MTDELVQTTYIIRAQKTERERRYGIASETRKRIREDFESRYPTARVTVLTSRADAETLTLTVNVDHGEER